MLTSNLVACRASGFFFKRDSEINGGGAGKGEGRKEKGKRKHLPAEPMKLKGGINVTVIKERRYRQFVATLARLSVWRKTKVFETE